MSARTKVSVSCLLRDGGPEVGIWIRENDEGDQHVHLDLDIETARELARRLERSALEAENWMKIKCNYIELD